MTLKDALVEYGLTEKEAAVYLAALELGSQTVNSIAKKANIFRTYCYDILRVLAEKGLITSFLKRGVKYYEAVDPDQFTALLHEREERISEVIPQLKLLKATAVEKPKTEVFEGKSGIKALHLDILKTGKDHYVFGSTYMIIDLLGPYFDIYVKERVKKKINVKVLVEDSPLTRKRIVFPSKKELREVRFYKKTKTPIKTTTYIYGDKLAMITYGKEVFGIIIHNKELADTERVLFDSLWFNSKTP